MALLRIPIWNLPLFVAIFTILELTGPSNSATDYTTLVYKGCAKEPLQDPTGVYSQALSSLFGTLIAQSSKSKFYKTTAGSSQTTINGLFQCRGDLSNVDCYNCVSRLPILIDKLCGKPIASRIHLLGCYMLYEVSGFAQISGMELLYKSCSGTNVRGTGFEEKRDTALSSLENGIGKSNGFFTTTYESVYVLGQCQGDLGTSDCVECVKNAVQKSQVECGSSVSGQIYLHRCFISYSYYSNGVPKQTPSSASDSSPSPSESGTNIGKTVAIIVGAAAGVGFLVIFLMFTRGLVKKKDVYPKVKVKEEVEEADQYAYEQNSLHSLKAFEWISLQDESPESVVRIPGSFIPQSPTPTFRIFKEDINENNKPVLEETGKKVRATSAPRPRAVLSSPDNDGIFGSKNQARKGQLFGLKNHFSSPNKHPQSKVFPRSVAVTLTPTQVHKKEAADGKSHVRGKVTAAMPDSNKRAHHQKRVAPSTQLNFL